MQVTTRSQPSNEHPVLLWLVGVLCDRCSGDAVGLSQIYLDVIAATRRFATTKRTPAGRCSHEPCFRHSRCCRSYGEVARAGCQRQEPPHCSNWGDTRPRRLAAAGPSPACLRHGAPGSSKRSAARTCSHFSSCPFPRMPAPGPSRLQRMSICPHTPRQDPPSAKGSPSGSSGTPAVGITGVNIHA